jgi:hypothetical protein
VSLRPDGSYRCDRCGTDVGNGSVQFAAVISTLEPSEQDDVAAVPVVYQLCRKPQTGAPNGCAARVLGPAALADYLKARTA